MRPAITPVGQRAGGSAYRPIRLALAITAFTCGAVVGLPRSGSAQALPVPLFTMVPTTATLQPYGSNDAGASTLIARGYVQEEWFISGTASGKRYTTRMLVRRPADPAKFSGIIIAESIRSTGIRTIWSLQDYLVRSGAAYVEIGANYLGMNNVVKPSSPERYATIDMPEIQGGVFGHVMEIIAQGGMLLKTSPKDGPFSGFRVRKIILGGCSEQGLIVRQYMRDGHPIYRMADGKSIFDGYFPACVADWPEQAILVNGQPFANFTPGPIEVPVINLTGQQEVEAWPEFGRKFERADSDAPHDRYRVYEVAGMGHGLVRSRTTCAAGQQPSGFASQYVAANALDKLIRWVDRGIAPPKADRLVAERRNGPIRKDGHGNALGGLRSVQVDVPIAAYFTGVGLCTYEVPFAAERLAQMYGAPSKFAARVRARVNELVAAGWYLAEDADSARGDATQPVSESMRRGAFSGGDQSRR
jgi:hypothetical protein